MSHNLIVVGHSRICLGTSTGQKPSCMNNCEGDFEFTPFQAVNSGTKSEVCACSKGRAQPAGLPLQNPETSLPGLFGAGGKALGFTSGCKARFPNWPRDQTEDFPGRREERELEFILKTKVGLMDFDSIKHIFNWFEQATLNPIP